MHVFTICIPILKESFIPATAPEVIVANIGVFVLSLIRDKKLNSNPSSAIA